MQTAAATPQVLQDIQATLANPSATDLSIASRRRNRNRNHHPRNNRNNPPSLTGYDAQCIIGCLQENAPRFNTLVIWRYDITHNPVVLNVFRNGLPLCTAVTTVILNDTHLDNTGLQCLLPAFYNTCITSLVVTKYNNNNIQESSSQHGGIGEIIRNLLNGNNTLKKFWLFDYPICHPQSGSALLAIGLGKGLATNNCLQILYLIRCNIGNDGLSSLVLSMMGESSTTNKTLLNLNLSSNNIQGAEGGRLVGLLLQCFPSLNVLVLDNNNLGPLGARALAPALCLLSTARASHLQRLDLCRCRLGNEGVANLVPSDGQVNISLTSLNLGGNNDIQGHVVGGGENIVALASRCTNLHRLFVDENILSPDQQHRLDLLLLDRNRLWTMASCLGGAPFYSFVSGRGTSTWS